MKTYTFTYKGQQVISRVPQKTFCTRMHSATRGGRKWTVEEAATEPRYSLAQRGRMAAAKQECRVAVIPRGETASPWVD